VDPDQFSTEAEQAKESVRQFIFAVKGGRWEIAAHYASPNLPLDPLKAPKYAAYFDKITTANASFDKTLYEGGIRLLIRVDVRGGLWYLPDFLVDPSTGLIVRAFFRSPENIYSEVPDPAGVTDPDFEAYTLKRFGLEADAAQAIAQAQTGSLYRVGGRVSAPVVIHSVEAQFSDVARKAKYQGVCVVSLIVDAQGNPQNPRIAKSLGMGLDEKAIEAVRQYRFRPAMLDGETPVPVAINMEINFRQY
jgi:TonB family protein